MRFEESGGEDREEGAEYLSSRLSIQLCLHLFYACQGQDTRLVNGFPAEW